ncbi:glycosyltransferase family 2 protein [Alkalimarinus coralli]|uniref:glycosyltransferase family 2 protein n=1 Tax=Alkalimarinus coralli TaxID=2935863 RepID=UPI00202AD012|nr:glycosyltransferase family 2 protein [Alkalimarinus coralli]
MNTQPPILRASIGVVVPAYNREKLILETLNAICAQTLQPELVVVVDDGSTDATKSVLEKWQKETPIKFTFIYHQQENKGVSSARNKGLRLVKECQWVAFLDSDDVWPTDLLDRLYTEIQKDTRYIACSSEANESFFELDNTLISSHLLSHTNGYGKHGPLGLMAAAPHISASIIRTDIALKVNGFDERMKYGEDRLFIMCVSCHGLWGRVAGEPILYRCYKKSLDVNQLSNKPHQNSRVRYARLLDQNLSPLINSKEIWHKGIPWALWKGWHRAGKQLEETGHYTWAATFYCKAAKYRPPNKSALRALLMLARSFFKQFKG